MVKGNKKLLAKNTLMLYCRMILTMVVTLYTSRVILKALGQVDYGVFSVVGGVVAMLGFFNSSIGASTQRFLNVGMVESTDTSLREVFSSAVNVHVIIGIITVILLETVGLWFVSTQLVIPTGQESAAMWVYQCSIATFFVSIISAPYNAAIIAYERMSAFAILSIADVTLKLAVAFTIDYYDGQRLILYSVLLLTSSIIMRFLYGGYCARVFKDIRYKFIFNLKLIKRMMAFSGWMTFGCLSDLLGTQGVNMLINIFFGPVFNASRAIAVQVQGAISQFATNFIISVNPQIVKSYSSGDKDYAYKLTFAASKISFFLMLLIVVPVTVKSQHILQLWLGEVPPYTAVFVNLILLEALIRSSYGPIAQINQASGNIRLYQIAITTLFIINFIGTYILYKNGFPVYSTFIISAAIAILGLLIRVLILKIQQNFPAQKYLIETSIPLAVVAITAYAIGFGINMLFKNGIPGLISSVIAIIFINMVLIWAIGLSHFEKCFIRSKTLPFMSRIAGVLLRKNKENVR